MTLRFREIEATSMYAGLGVQLIDEFASVPAAAVETPPLGFTSIDIDIDDGGSWRAVDPALLLVTRTPGGIVWYPWLEHHRDARGLPPRKYRVRVFADAFAPRYRYDSDGVEVLIAPHDDVNPPASLPTAPLKVPLLPAPSYPFPAGVPVLRGRVVDGGSAPVPDALVSWSDPTLQTDSVLSDVDGEFALPMRRAARNVPIDIHAARPPPPGTGRSGTVSVRIPQDLSIFHTISIS